MVRDGAPDSESMLPERLPTMGFPILLRADAAAFPQHLCCRNWLFGIAGTVFSINQQ
jgi:hypothetical protein